MSLSGESQDLAKIDMTDELLLYNELDIRTPWLLKSEFREELMIALSNKFKHEDGKYRYKEIQKKLNQLALVDHNVLLDENLYGKVAAIKWMLTL